MIILKINRINFIMISLVLTSCSVSKKIQKDLYASSAEEIYFKGISVLQAETGESLIDLHEDMYFTPASNVKLFTLYTAWKNLPDSIPAFDFVKKGDSLILKGTANPLFLTDSLSVAALAFLKNSDENIYLTDDHIEDDVYGLGWSWDDYTYDYMPEKHLFPIYGNVISVDKAGDSIKVIPDFFKNKVHLTPSVKESRKKDENEFYIEAPADISNKKIPFKSSNQLVADLLSSELDRKVILVNDNIDYQFKAFREVPYDTLYTRMMVNSDNFLAEQLMLRVGSVTKGTYSVSAAIQYALENYMPDIPQKPRWVDGSGLSRYNLFSPKSMVYLLKKMYDEIPHDLLFSYFPRGGINGTLKNDFRNQSYIYAKSGSLSNNYSLSGYLITKKGKVIIFSYMTNHFPSSSSNRKREISAFLKKLHESY
ncbi:D-alanyl-D-alanine carboxypeptidase/D-alanyl-D-alanine-endopeptidase [Lutimonas vermicola]|uniref:D-alanyl-D-alanine carboxypeptidase n=1 Tax=Lutimonas vermicola TaxID=414288 RepID=A0ABU9KY86_9FLAO